MYQGAGKNLRSVTCPHFMHTVLVRKKYIKQTIPTLNDVVGKMGALSEVKRAIIRGLVQFLLFLVNYNCFYSMNPHIWPPGMESRALQVS
jgi:hypothetical protein